MKNAWPVSKAYRKYISELEFAVEELKRIDYLTDKAVDNLDEIVGDVNDASEAFLKVIGEYQRAPS